MIPSLAVSVLFLSLSCKLSALPADAPPLPAYDTKHTHTRDQMSLHVPPSAEAWRICMAAIFPQGSFTHTQNTITNTHTRTHTSKGTPISRGLEDLYGLLYFLKAAPWDDRRWWSAALQASGATTHSFHFTLHHS